MPVDVPCRGREGPLLNASFDLGGWITTTTSASPETPVATVDRVEARPAGIDEDALDDVRTCYALRSPEEVTPYLRTYPHLVPLLLEAAEVIRRYFGPDVPLVLESFTDPEEDKPRPELFAQAQTSLGPEAALDRLDRLGEDWWFEKSPDAPAVLVFDVEFV